MPFLEWPKLEFLSKKGTYLILPVEGRFFHQINSSLLANMLTLYPPIGICSGKYDVLCIPPPNHFSSLFNLLYLILPYNLFPFTNLSLLYYYYPSHIIIPYHLNQFSPHVTSNVSSLIVYLTQPLCTRCYQ